MRSMTRSMTWHSCDGIVSRGRLLLRLTYLSVQRKKKRRRQIPSRLLAHLLRSRLHVQIATRAFRCRVAPPSQLVEHRPSARPKRLVERRVGQRDDTEALPPRRYEEVALLCRVASRVAQEHERVSRGER